MKVTEKHLEIAVEKNILSAEQSHALVEFLRSQPSVGASFNFASLIYYFGGCIAIGAMTLFMGLGWERFGGWGIFFICLLYAGAGLTLARFFQARAYSIPAGICATFVVALTPLALYGLQNALGFWPDDSPYTDYHRYIQWHWIYLELGTLAVGLIMAWAMRYPFMLMPVAVTLWYMSMDVSVMLTGDYSDWQFRAFISMWFGFVVMLIALWTDLRSRHSADYAFWLYIFGVMAFWCGLSSQASDSELSKFFYFCINLSLIAFGGIVVRKVLVIFGALGSAMYLGYLAHTVFKNSWLFPIVLTAIGLLIVCFGMLWQRNEKAITQQLHAWLPSHMKQLLEARLAGARLNN